MKNMRGSIFLASLTIVGLVLVGTVTAGMAALKKGDVVGVRGPFDSAWPVAEAEGSDVVIIAGKGHEDYQIIGAKRLDFDDRIEAERAMQLREKELRENGARS